MIKNNHVKIRRWLTYFRVKKKLQDHGGLLYYEYLNAVIMFYLKLFVGFLGIYQKVFKPLTGMEGIFVILLAAVLPNPLHSTRALLHHCLNLCVAIFPDNFNFLRDTQQSFSRKNVEMSWMEFVSYLKTSSLVQSFLQLTSPMVLKSETFKSTVNLNWQSQIAAAFEDFLSCILSLSHGTC